jgi:3D (Asp-Asp-Asp) domain-containing protein
MPAIALVALMGFIFMPGNTSAPTSDITTGPAAKVMASEGEEPSKRLATSKEVAPSLLVTMTAYNAVPDQTDGDPTITASGAFSNPEVVAARSRDLAEELPFGTVIRIERTSKDTPNCRFSEVEHQIGYRVIADTMHSRWTKKVDILLNEDNTVADHGVERNPGVVLGVCSDVTITVVGSVDVGRMPTSQAELAKMFGKATLALK